VKASGTGNIKAPKTELNPGSAAEASKAEGTVSEVPDPLK